MSQGDKPQVVLDARSAKSTALRFRKGLAAAHREIGQFAAVHAAGHDDVGEQHRYLIMAGGAVRLVEICAFMAFDDRGVGKWTAEISHEIGRASPLNRCTSLLRSLT
jgi:hypothetical protein